MKCGALLPIVVHGNRVKKEGLSGILDLLFVHSSNDWLLASPEKGKVSVSTSLVIWNAR